MGQHDSDSTAFVVSGCVAGENYQVRTNSPAEAAERLAAWLDEVPATRNLSWRINPAWPDTVLLAARLRDSVNTAPSARPSHLFVFLPGDQIGPELVAQCRARFVWRDLEFGTELNSVFGMPCGGCEMTLVHADDQPPVVLTSAQPPGDSAVDLTRAAGWNGWDVYYNDLGWPVTEEDGQLLLTAPSDRDGEVVALSVPAVIGDRVQRCLAVTDMQAPVLRLPTLPEELLFIVTGTNVPVPMPPRIRHVPADIPLPPSPTADGDAQWATSPGDVQPGRCRDLDVLACVYRLFPPRPPQQRGRELAP